MDWVEGTLFIGLTKYGEPLLAPLSGAALARLRMIPRIAGNPYIICGQRLGKHLSNLHAAFKRVEQTKPESIVIDSLLLPNPETNHADACADQARHRHYFSVELLEDTQGVVRDCDAATRG